MEICNYPSGSVFAIIFLFFLFFYFFIFLQATKALKALQKMQPFCFQTNTVHGFTDEYAMRKKAERKEGESSNKKKKTVVKIKKARNTVT